VSSLCSGTRYRVKVSHAPHLNRIVPLPPTLIPADEAGRNARRLTSQKLHIHCLSLTTFQPHPWAVNARAATERGERLAEDGMTTTLEDVFGQMTSLGSLVIQVSDDLPISLCESSLEVIVRYAMRRSSCTRAVLPITRSATPGSSAGTGTRDKRYSCVQAGTSETAQQVLISCPIHSGAANSATRSLFPDDRRLHLAFT
jgi:hypothetical protein